jgi:hypothetical protein
VDKQDTQVAVTGCPTADPLRAKKDATKGERGKAK